MGLIAESAAQKARLAGAKANLRNRGRLAKVISQSDEDNDAEITVLVDDGPAMSDPMQPAQAETPVYSYVSCLASSIDDPRKVTGFTMVKDQKDLDVFEFMETAGDRIWWKWRCEAGREVFGGD